MLEIYTSLNLELVDPMPVAVGAAPPDSIMAGADDDEAEADMVDEELDTCIGNMPPISDDDMPLASL